MLRFNPKITAVHFDFAPEDYKATRSKEICEMAEAQGFTRKDCEMMIAHLYHECGSMSEDCGWKAGSYRSDAGLAIGIAQWHLCYREKPWMVQNGFMTNDPRSCPHNNPKKAAVIREKFFRDFPEMTDWRFQAKRYISEISNCVENRSLASCIDSWNANPAYMTLVRQQIAMARTLLK